MAVATSTVLAIASIATTAIGTGVSVYGQQQAAKSEEAAQRNNALNLKQTAKAREAEAQEAIRRQQREARRELATMRATMAASGSQINDGSNQDILGAATLRLETRINDYARQSSLESRALNHSAALAKWEGSQARTAANYSSASTVLQGAGSQASSAYNFNRAGAL